MQTPDIVQLQDRAFYHHWHDIDIRIADLDDQHHVNNAIFAVYCEEGRRKFWEPSWHLIRAEKVMTFIAKLSIDFHLEMGYPGRVEVGTAIKRIGNSSYAMAQALFIDQNCHATIEVVSVIASIQTRKPISIPDSLRAHLQQNLGG